MVDRVQILSLNLHTNNDHQPRGVTPSEILTDGSMRTKDLVSCRVGFFALYQVYVQSY